MRRYFKFFALALLAIFILWFFGKDLHWGEIAQSLRKAEWLQLFAATAIICLGYLLRAFRWRTLLAPITESNLKELFATTTVGFAAVFLFGRMGEMVRPLWLPMRDRRVRPSAALATIGVERICDLISIVSIFALNLLWFKAPEGQESEFTLVNRAGLLMLVAMFFGIVALVIFQRYSDAILRWVEPILLEKLPLPRRLTATIFNLFQSLAASLQILKDPKELAITIFWTVMLWLSVALPTYLVITAFDLPLGFSDALFVMGAASLGSLVPTPGGAAGAFHAATAAAMMSISAGRYTKEDAAAVALIMHLVYFAPALIFGVYYFAHGDISWQRLRSLVINETDESNAAEQTQELKIKNYELKMSK